MLDSTKLMDIFYYRRALKKGVLLYIHINFVISLSLALAVFVVGIESATGYNVSDIFVHLINFSYVHIIVYYNNEMIVIMILVKMFAI